MSKRRRRVKNPKKIDLSEIKSVYMIGIKGAGMTMLAQFFKILGINVTGSDTSEVFMTDKSLKTSGIKVKQEFKKANIPEKVDLIVYSSAYNAKNNIEVKAAQESKIKTLPYAEVLAEIFNLHYGVAVIGSHGKTTTSAWLGYVMDKALLRPHVLVGAPVPQFGGNVLEGDSAYMVAEIDEYQNKLQYFKPKVILLNNVDYDHPDFFKTKNEYIQVFVDFLKKMPQDGVIVANFDDLTARNFSNANSKAKVAGYAIEKKREDLAEGLLDRDAPFYRAGKIEQKKGKQYFRVKNGDEDLGIFEIQLIGRHNIYNALAVIAFCDFFGVSHDRIRKYLAEFKGTARRMQVLGKFKGALIIDDYAHHPTEIKTTLQGARQNYQGKRLRVVFHPHTFTRSKAFFDDFTKSFEEADEVVVLDIYGSAREEQGGIHSKDIVDELLFINKKDKRKQEAKYIPSLKECAKYLRETASENDVILLMGAGDVFRIGEALVN